MPRSPFAGTLLALALVTATLPFWDLGHPLWEVDDARYAEVPREMAESGDWLTPRLNYIDYLQKPPLMYWLGNLSYKALGVCETASRVPLAWIAVLGLAATAWLGAWLFSPAVGLSAAVMLGTCAEFSVLSHLQTPDMALAVFLLWTCAMILRVLHKPEDAGWAGAIAGACAALAFLSKGIVAFVFPAAWAALLAALFPELRRGCKRLCLSPAVFVAAAAIVPWLWLMEERHPGFLHHFFIEHHFQRYLTSEFNRQGPWYYFLAVDFGGLLPWTALAAVASAAPLLRWRKTDPRLRQLALWVGLVFAFFSASKSKLPTYILPIFPFQCLMAAQLLERLKESPWEQAWTRRISLGLGAMILAAVPAALILGPERMAQAGIPHSLLWTCAAAASVLGVGTLSQALTTRMPPWKSLSCAAIAGWIVTGLFLVGARQAGPLLSAKDVSAAILSQWQPGDRILTYDFYLHGIPFYTGKPVDVVNWRGELRVAEGDPRYAGRLGNDDTIRALPGPGKTSFIVVRRKVAPYFLSMISEDKLHSMQTYGNSLLAVCCK